MLEKEPLDTFEFSGGRLCLDFANTLTDRTTDTPTESLHTYEDLLSWGRQAAILSDEEFARLLKVARKQPGDAAEWLIASRHQREFIYQIFSAIAEGQVPQAQVVEQFNHGLGETLRHLVLMSDGEATFTWSWAGDANALDRPIWPIVRSATDLLTSSELGRVRICSSEDCRWLFLDTSKNQSRRWCDMKSCGNRAKARRHYDRKKSTGA